MPRVLFVLNPDDTDTVASVSIGGNVRRADDLLRDQSFDVVGGAFELAVKAKTVRMLALAM